jgi:hypothetical protein
MCLLAISVIYQLSCMWRRIAEHAPSWKQFSVMHVHMLEPKSKLVHAAPEDGEEDDTDDGSDSDSSDSAASDKEGDLASITGRYLHGSGSAPAEAAAAAAGGGASGIGELMQHADAMLRSDKAQLAAAHTAHKDDVKDVLRERCGISLSLPSSPSYSLPPPPPAPLSLCALGSLSLALPPESTSTPWSQRSGCRRLGRRRRWQRRWRWRRR